MWTSNRKVIAFDSCWKNSDFFSSESPVSLTENIISHMLRLVGTVYVYLLFECMTTSEPDFREHGYALV